MPTLDYGALLQTAIEEARQGLSEGGVPIGAALFDADGRHVAQELMLKRLAIAEGHDVGAGHRSALGRKEIVQCHARGGIGQPEMVMPMDEVRIPAAGANRLAQVLRALPQDLVARQFHVAGTGGHGEAGRLRRREFERG